jgi:hypothetical protein
MKTAEDEAWEAIERKQQAEQQGAAIRRAILSSVAFINECDPRELGILTLRKAYEIGYYQALQDKKN